MTRAWVLVVVTLVGAQDPDIDAHVKGLSSESEEVRTKSAQALIALGEKVEAKVRETRAASEGETLLLCDMVLARIAWRTRVETELPPLRRVTIAAKEQPLKEVLAEIRRQSDFALEFGEVKDAPVTVDVRSASPLEAITALCKAAGLGFSLNLAKSAKYPVIAFKEGDYADSPRFFSNHFMVEIVSITLTRRTGAEASGTLVVKLTWPPGVLPEQGLLDVVTIADDRGRRLFERPERAAYGSSDFDGGIPGNYRYSTTARIDFKHPGDDVEKIGSIRGSALLLFAGEDRFLTLAATEGSLRRKKQMSGVTAELRGIKVEGDVTTVTFAHEGWPAPAMPNARSAPRGLGHQYWQVRLQDGTIAVCRNSGTRHDGSMRVEELKFLGLTSKVASVEVLAETIFHRETFEFEFKDVPLPR